jgi:hypothetical protein
MRKTLIFVFGLLGVLAFTTPAFADMLGCGDGEKLPPDMSSPAHDLSTPRDLSHPRDARRDPHRRRRAAAAGMLLLSGLSLGGVAAARCGRGRV